MSRSSDQVGRAPPRANEEIMDNPINVLKAPMTKEALEAASKEAFPEDGYVHLAIALDLGDLIDTGDVDGMNDLAEEKIIGEAGCATLIDISYRVVGHVPGSGDGLASGQVIVEVTAIIDFFE